MIDFFILAGIGVTAFVATNVDDIFVLMMFFSSRRFHTLEVIFGQYLGIATLIIVSTIGSFLALIIPQLLIGLLGVVPISIGIMRLIQLRRGHKESVVDHTGPLNKLQRHYSLLAVAAVTISNGGDNIGIYTPLFAKYNGIPEIISLVMIFMGMTGVWCVIGYCLVNHPMIAKRFRDIGDKVFPFVLIGLGIYIIVQAVL